VARVSPSPFPREEDAVDKARLILVDDHKVLRAGLRALINQQLDLDVVGEADTARAARELAASTQPDLVVLDLTLPGGGSLELISELVEAGPLPRVLVLSMHNDPAYARAALGAGATGYVVKTVSEEDLLAAIRAVRRGKAVVDLDDEARTASVFGAGGPQAVRGPARATVGLSPREREVLCLLGQGHTNQAVAERLDLSPKTVATYRARIGEKLGLKTTADFVRYATDTGLLGNSDPLS
jgi:DNA-binding NarL/FixJ family response regulator